MGSSFSSIFKRSGMCRPSGNLPLFVVYVKNRETRWKNSRKVILKGKVGPSTKMKNIPLVFGTCSSTPRWGPVLGEVERDALSSGSRWCPGFREFSPIHTCCIIKGVGFNPMFKNLFLKREFHHSSNQKKVSFTIEKLIYKGLSKGWESCFFFEPFPRFFHASITNIPVLKIFQTFPLETPTTTLLGSFTFDNFVWNVDPWSPNNSIQTAWNILSVVLTIQHVLTCL